MNTRERQYGRGSGEEGSKGPYEPSQHRKLWEFFPFQVTKIKSLGVITTKALITSHPNVLLSPLPLSTSPWNLPPNEGGMSANIPSPKPAHVSVPHPWFPCPGTSTHPHSVQGNELPQGRSAGERQGQSAQQGRLPWMVARCPVLMCAAPPASPSHRCACYRGEGKIQWIKE